MSNSEELKCNYSVILIYCPSLLKINEESGNQEPSIDSRKIGGKDDEKHQWLAVHHPKDGRSRALCAKLSLYDAVPLPLQVVNVDLEKKRLEQRLFWLIYII